MTATILRATAGLWEPITTPLPPPPGAKGLVGCYVKTSTFGTATQEAANAAWAALSERPLKVRRAYFPAGNIPSTMAQAALGADAAAGRKVCLSFRPAFDPVSQDDYTTLAALLADCAAGGLEADVSLYPEAYGSGMSAADTIAATRLYAAAVRAHYPLVFDTSAYAVQHSNENSFFAGSDVIDKIVTDFYCSEYDGGVRLDLSASLADANDVPFGIWEWNISTDASQGQTPAQGAAYVAYLRQFFAARLTAGKPNADLLLFNSASVITQETQITSAGDYRIGLYQSLYDTLSA
jgi:hypothetical protein